MGGEGAGGLEQCVGVEEFQNITDVWGSVIHPLPQCVLLQGCFSPQERAEKGEGGGRERGD